MCGIHATVSVAIKTQAPSRKLEALLRNRGPDHLGSVELLLTDQPVQVAIRLTSTVLALRGKDVVKQPLQDTVSGSVLCWNGEAWSLDGLAVDGNDGQVILSRLTSNANVDALSRKAQILDVFRGIQGPFAFVFYDAPHRCLYYSRDRLGRRSLLKHEADLAANMSFSSIADTPTAEWKEVMSDAIYSIEFSPHLGPDGAPNLGARVSRHNWLRAGGADLVSSIGRFNMTLPTGGERLDFDSPAVENLRHRLTESLKLRVLDIPEPPDAQVHVDIRLAILFSGGLDCSVLARLAHDLLPESQGVDLINVAFENPRVAAQMEPTSDPAHVYEICPDRITGRKALAELQSACASRFWRFIAVNVSFSEAMKHRSQVVSLMYPHDTEMDLSIALALYFAGRGTGECYTATLETPAREPRTVTTPARVLLSGLGADELFGGYSRHVAVFERQGYHDLIDELQLDVSRIGQRNLGRDDRVLAHWGKEVRFPYLDEALFKFAVESPVWDKCDFDNKAHPAVIEPAKRVLRLLADQLGLPSIAREKKRAIQFGTRTAKLERATGRVKGTALIEKAST